MPTNQGFTMNIKANNGTVIPLYPSTISSQVLGWDIGKIYGPYTIDLPALGWANNQQTVTLTGISPNDIPVCVKILNGTDAEMKAQDSAYSLLNPLTGVASGDNEIVFTCTETPQVDFQVQISWTK